MSVAGVATERPRILARQMVETADGARLCSDVYLPEVEQARPAILVRTPYGRSVPLLMQLALQLARAGFCAVLQDCRGRHRSSGAYDLLCEEGDSRSTLRWLASQQWCDGRVGLVGISISSLPNLLVAARPDAGESRIVGLVNIMGAIDYHLMCYRGGALLLHWTLPWTAMMGSAHGIADWRGLDWRQTFRHRPLLEAARQTGASDELWRLIVSQPCYGGFWESLTTADGLEGLAPVLHLSGWQDFMLDQALLGWSQLSGRPGVDRHRLIIGPWNHRTLFSETAAPTVTDGGLSLGEVLVWWFGRCLGKAGPRAGSGFSLDDRPPVLLHVGGADAWLGATAFPLPEAQSESWFLTSAGRANGSAGDGRLVRRPAVQQGMDVFDYDPADPVPTVGGAVWPFGPGGLVPGPADQSEVERRADVLVYSSEPLAQDLAVVGPVRLELWSATSARDTDFTGKLVDVDARGAASWVQDGIARGRFRNRRDAEELLEPQRPYRFEIALGATAHLFQAGHRLRLEVASSNFPKFDNHLNSAEPFHTATAAMVARQTVFHGGELASCLHLPVLPPAALAALRLDLPGKG